MSEPAEQSIDRRATPAAGRLPGHQTAPPVRRVRRRRPPAPLHRRLLRRTRPGQDPVRPHLRRRRRLGPLVQRHGTSTGHALPASLLASRTVMYTPYVTITARRAGPRSRPPHPAASSADIERASTPDYDPELTFDVDASLPHRTGHHRRGRPAENHRPGTAPRLLRPPRPRPDPDRHARLRPATRPLPAAVQPDRLRPPIPAAGPRRHPDRAGALLAPTRPTVRSRTTPTTSKPSAPSSASPAATSDSSNDS